jgi:hypothetical protein
MKRGGVKKYEPEKATTEKPENKNSMIIHTSVGMNVPA